MPGRPRKEYNWEYYKKFLKQYCDYRLSYSDRIPPESPNFGRKYYSPWVAETDKGSTGSFYINDPVDKINGHNYTMWWDNKTKQHGNIYKLMMLLDGYKNAAEAYERCEQMFGKAPELTPEERKKQNKSYHRKAERAHYRVQKDKDYQSKLDEEERRCKAIRKNIEEKIIKNIETSGTLFTHMDRIPVYLQEKKGELITQHMSNANYMQAMLLHQEDPRYISARAAATMGYRIKEGATPIIFEYEEHKDEGQRLKLWPLYNAKDVIGLPAYQEPLQLKQEEVVENIKTLLQANDVPVPKEEAQGNLVGIPESLLEGVRKVAEEATWKKAVNRGQRGIERELVTTRLLQYVGSREPYAITKDKYFIEEHLKRDIESRGSRNLFRSGGRMDQGVSKIIENYNNTSLEEARNIYAQIMENAKNPFEGLLIRADKDLDLPGEKTVPKGAEIRNAKAYRYLAALVKEDRRLFAKTHQEGYGREMAFTVSFGASSYPVRVNLGQLDMGNSESIIQSLHEGIMKERRSQVYDRDARDTAVQEIVRKKAYEDAEYYKAVIAEPVAVAQKEAKHLRDMYIADNAKLYQDFEPLTKDEAKYMKKHPELKLKRADTYQYIVLDTPDKAWSQEELVTAYEANVVVSTKTAADMGLYQNDSDIPIKGTVVETRVPFEEDRSGYYTPLGKSMDVEIPARPMPQDVEKWRMKEVEDKFTVTLGLPEKKHQEILKGDEARTCLAILMTEDREMWDEQQSGYKDREMSMPQHVAVSWGDTKLFEKDIYPGKLDLGNAHTVGEAVADLADMSDSKIKQNVLTMQQALHTVEKYTPEQQFVADINQHEKVSAEEIAKAKERQYTPLDMDRYRPTKIGQKLANKMMWYDAVADVNFAHRPKEKAAYITRELAGKYKAETIQKYMAQYYPTQGKIVDQTLQEPKVQQTLQETAERREKQHAKGRVR